MGTMSKRLLYTGYFTVAPQSLTTLALFRTAARANSAATPRDLQRSPRNNGAFFQFNFNHARKADAL